MLMTQTMTMERTDAAHDGARPLYVFFGHHKCATGWIDGILRETCFNLGWRFHIVHRPIDFERHGSLGRYVAAERPDLLAYTNADRDYIGDLPAFRGFHVVRDPRDVLVSGYFSHRNTHPTEGWPELVEHRKRLRAVSKEEGLMLEMDFSRQFLDPMNRWDYEMPNVLEMKMEEISADPEAAFRRIYTFLGLLDTADATALQYLTMRLNILNQRGRRFTPFHMPMSPFRFPMERLPKDRLRPILERKSFKRMSGGRKPGQENVKSHYRKGRPGDWRNHFTEAHIDRFKERYNDLVLKLGYETDPDWR